MPKFFFDPAALNGSLVTLRGSEARHMIRVLRMKAGDRVILCDGYKTDYHCAIDYIQVNDGIITLTVEAVRPCEIEPPVRVTLYQGLPKGEKMEWAVQKCVELGIHAIIPVITARTVPQARDFKHKTERCQRVAASAAAQSMRGVIPRVSPPLSYSAAVRQADQDIHLIAYEKELNCTVKQALRHQRFSSLGLWVGAEGGFTEEEVSVLQSDLAARAVTLGPRVLRAETAGMAALIHILCALEV